MVKEKDIQDLDVYELLGVGDEATEKEIRTAFRKKALKCHPDKNPGEAAKVLFKQISDALELLTDEEQRKAYDNKLKAKKAAQIRNRLLDAKRRKVKEDLEEREKLAREREKEEFQIKVTKNEEERIKEEDKEERRRMEEEEEQRRERRRKLIEEEMRKAWEEARLGSAAPGDQSKGTKLKVRWKLDPNAQYQYDRDSLKRLFWKYGDVSEVVVSSAPKKSGKMSALIEMKDRSAAVNAEKIEIGYPNYPLKVKLLESDNNDDTSDLKTDSVRTNNRSANGSAASNNFGASSFSYTNNSETISERDYESLTLRNLRQAQERKRLIEQMMEEEKD